MGSRILYYLVIKPVSFLPHFLLYRVSDFFYVILFYLVGYRKKVVMQNLQGCFPDQSEQELKRIRRKFYRHFTDVVVESLKNFSISAKQAERRMEAIGADVVNRLNEQGRSVVLCGGHQNNWELWAVSSGLHLNPTVIGVYKQLSNAFFDQKMKESRAKFGMLLIPTYGLKEELQQRSGEAITTVYAVDQSPSNPRKAYWMMFLGRETACFYGPEKFAKEHDAAVVYASLRKSRRGFYQVEYQLVYENVKDAAYGEIIRTVNRLLEKDILSAPHQWLWTHKRWKHARPEEMPLDTQG